MLYCSKIISVCSKHHSLCTLKFNEKKVYNLWCKISAKGKNILCSCGGIEPKSHTEKTSNKTSKSSGHSWEYSFELRINVRLTSKSWEPWTHYKNLWNSPFLFKISQCIPTLNILLCNKMHLKLAHKDFFHAPWKNLR